MLNNKNIIKKIFPYIKNLERIKIDDESLSYISIKDDADYITNIIKKNFNISKMSIVDATAGVGGNTLSFSKSFNNVYSIELDKKRFEMLNNNISIYELKNVNVYNDDCLNLIFNIKYDIIFFDPPWGGRDYKNYKNLRLHISKTPIEDICIKLKEKNIKIVLKLPKNYDIDFLKKKLNIEKLNIEKLNKMLIIIL